MWPEGCLFPGRSTGSFQAQQVLPSLSSATENLAQLLVNSVKRPAHKALAMQRAHSVFRRASKVGDSSVRHVPVCQALHQAVELTPHWTWEGRWRERENIRMNDGQDKVQGIS